MASEDPAGHVCTQPALGQAAAGAGRAPGSGASLAMAVSTVAAWQAHLAVAGQGPHGPRTPLTGRSRLAVACCWRI
ncbi:hypothetical protein ACWIGX_28175 [Streptomyces nigrescens]